MRVQLFSANEKAEEGEGEEEDAGERIDLVRTSMTQFTASEKNSELMRPGPAQTKTQQATKTSETEPR